MFRTLNLHCKKKKKKVNGKDDLITKIHWNIANFIFATQVFDQFSNIQFFTAAQNMNVEWVSTFLYEYFSDDTKTAHAAAIEQKFGVHRPHCSLKWDLTGIFIFSNKCIHG